MTSSEAPLPDLLAERDLPELGHEEIRRYGRHLSLSEVGMTGQRRLKAARVLMIGTGGLGSPVGLYLAAAGVGRLGMVDFDRVDESNLQRQVLFGQSDLGRPKVEVARERLSEINPHIELVLHDERLTADNAAALVAQYDLVVDGSDNFPTRYLVNDACVLAGKPCVWGAVQRFEGQVSVFWAGPGPCYRCLFPQPPPPGSVPNCAEAGVLGMLPGMIGTMQANEVVKLLLGQGEALLGRLMIVDALGANVRTVRIQKSPDCPICSADATIDTLIAVGEACEAPTMTESDAEKPVAESPSSIPFEIDVLMLRQWQAEGRDFLLIDVREPHEFEICQIEGSELMPLSKGPDQFAALTGEQPVVVHCHHGPRSSQVVAYLRQQGCAGATNLAGGIDAWSLQIDPSVPRY